ncbi:MAG: hypothetical protein MPK62_14660 [Alphaproteobacteria bacterium]|nr:hypothetical protein [Alphaproteobacteria bacterium]
MSGDGAGSGDGAERLRGRGLLVCPVTRGYLEWTGDYAVSARAGLRFSCGGGVADLRRDAAESLRD